MSKVNKTLKMGVGNIRWVFPQSGQCTGWSGKPWADGAAVKMECNATQCIYRCIQMYKVDNFMQKCAIKANFITHFFPQNTFDEKGLSEHLNEVQGSLKYINLELKLVWNVLQYGAFFVFLRGSLAHSPWINWDEVNLVSANFSPLPTKGLMWSLAL